MERSQSIVIKIAERPYEFKIRKEEEEECIRRAARLIGDKLIQYQKQFSNKDAQDFLAMEALRYAVRTIDLEAKVSSAEHVDKLHQLNERLDVFLKQCAES